MGCLKGLFFKEEDEYLEKRSLQDLFFEFGNLSDVLFWVRFELALTVTATQTYNLFLVGNGLIGINITTGKGAFLAMGAATTSAAAWLPDATGTTLAAGSFSHPVLM